MKNANTGLAVPRPVKLFVAVHVAAVALMGVAAWLMGGAYQDQAADNAAPLQLVPISAWVAADATETSR